MSPGVTLAKQKQLNYAVLFDSQPPTQIVLAKNDYPLNFIHARPARLLDGCTRPPQAPSQVMKTPLLLVSCLALLVGPDISAQAVKEASTPKPKEASTPKPREIQDMLNVVPKSDLLKLRGKTLPDATIEIGQKIMAAEVNKVGTFRITFETVSPEINNAEKGWVVTCRQKPVKSGGVSIDIACYVHIREDPEKLLEKMRGGHDLIVTGNVTEAKLGIGSNAPLLNVVIVATNFK